MTSEMHADLGDPGLPRAEARSLAMHELIAQKITVHPELLEVARENIARWSATRYPTPRWIAEWREILERPWSEISAFITDPKDERSVRLRKSSPFAGVLTDQERGLIFDAFKSG
jgi:hypothetical protein